MFFYQGSPMGLSALRPGAPLCLRPLRFVREGREFGRGTASGCFIANGVPAAKVVLLAPQTPYVLQTPDNPYGAPPAYFDQVRVAWATDYPKWVQDNKLPFFTAETSAQMMEWIQTELLRAHVPTAITCNR